jgi:hypothetical protein
MRKVALFLVIFSLVFAGTVTAETLDEAVLRSGCVIGEIDIPDSLTPGETYTITWMVQSYVDIRSRFQIIYSDSTSEQLEGNLYDKKTGKYQISDYRSHEYFFSIQYSVPYGKGGDARVGFHNSQSDGNWWMYSLFPTGVIDRPYGTAGKQFYVSILNAEAPTGWASVSYLTVSPSSVNFDENFQISFTLKEVNGAAKSFENVAIAILDPYDGLVFDWAMFSNVTIPANGTFSESVTNSIYARNDRPNGTYKAVIRGKVDGQWFDFDTTGNGVNPKMFTVGGGNNDFPSDVSIDAFVQAKNGNCTDMDGAWGCQCVDLMHAYIQDVLGVPRSDHGIRGNAYDIYAGINGSADISSGSRRVRLEKIDNTPSGIPQKGDIIFWNKAQSNGWFGHVAIFLGGDDVYSFTSLDQNWYNSSSSGSPAAVVNHNYNDVAGWLRPVLISN